MTLSSFLFGRTKKIYLVFVFVSDIKLSWRCSYHHQHGRVGNDESSCARGCQFKSHLGCIFRLCM